MSIFGQCDCCERISFLCHIMSPYAGETYACAECSGHDVGEFDPEPEPCEFCGEELKS